MEERSAFLDHRAFVGLAAGIPLVILITSRLRGALPGALPSVGHFAGSALATAVCTLLVGGLLHVVINATAKHTAVAVPWLYGLLLLVGLVTVVGSMMVLLPQLTSVCPAIPGRVGILTMQAVGIGAAYVAVARAVAVVGNRARQHAERAQQSELQAQHARLETLKAQMSPHFLFNALNSVASLIPENPKLAESTLERLAGVLQYSLLANKRERVRVSEELTAVRDYLDVEEARFEGRLRSRIDVSPELLDREILPLLLQPLVENAVVHGLQEGGTGEIMVRGRIESGVMVLTVSDDGVGPGNSTRHGTRIGLGHLQERLDLTYGGATQVTIRQSDSGGFECELRIPETT